MGHQLKAQAIIEDITSLQNQLDQKIEDLKNALFEISLGDLHPNTLIEGSLAVCKRGGWITWNGQDVTLSPMETKIIATLARRPGVVFSRYQIIEDIRSGDPADVFDRSVDSQMKRIRNAFKKIDPSFNQIATVYGVGYKWNKEHGN